MTHEFIVKVSDTQLDFFKELLDNLKIPFQTTAHKGRNKVNKKTSTTLTPEQQAFVNDLRVSFKEVEAAKRGETTLQSLESFLNELDSEVATNHH